MSKSTKKSKKNKKKHNRNERAASIKENRTAAEQYNDYCSKMKYQPDSFADIDLARAFAKNFDCEAKYLGKDNWVCYNGVRWVSNNEKVQQLAHNFLDDLEKEIARAGQFYNAIPHNGLAYCTYPHKTVNLNPLQLRSSMKTSAIIKEAAPYMKAEEKDFDSKPFLLNTPDATYDLRKGLKYPQKHRATDLITQTTRVSPSTKGMGIWEQALNDFFCNDQDLIDYMQQLMGLACVGKVIREELIVAFGNGANGKSTFFNAIRQVLGDYATSLTSDLLSKARYSNADQVTPEMKGKRLVIFSEIKNGAMLDDGLLKRTVSADLLFGNGKYQKAKSFTPTHTAVLPSNHLPRIDATDYGTERRIKIVPFLARFRDSGEEGTKSDRKDYTTYLVEQAGGAILSWLIVGAQKVIANDSKIEEPYAVKKLTESCLNANNWLKAFLEDCCIEDHAAKATSKALYEKYTTFASDNGYKVVTHKNFSYALKEHGFSAVHRRNGTYFNGIRLKPEEGVDELPVGDAESDKPDEVDSASNPNEETKNTESLNGDANP